MINLSGKLTTVDAYVVWRPILPDRDVVQLCTGDGHVLMEFSPGLAVQIGEELILHGRAV